MVVTVDALKRKAINEYNNMLEQLRNGNKSDYHYILDLISYISLPREIANGEFIKQQLYNAHDIAYLHIGKQR